MDGLNCHGLGVHHIKYRVWAKHTLLLLKLTLRKRVNLHGKRLDEPSDRRDQIEIIKHEVT